MARVTGPLMSFDASGTIAGSIVFAKWRGRNYVRRHAVPANPRSQAQLCARAIMGFLANDWKNLTDEIKATWAAGADALKISPFNYFAKINARNWRDMMAPSQSYPGARIQTPVGNDGLTALVSGRQVTLTCELTATTDAWGIAITRSLVTEENDTIASTIGIVKVTAGTLYFTDGPLSPDTYYYNFIPFTEDGKLGVAGVEDDATVV